MNTALFLTCTLWAPLLRWSRRRFSRSMPAGVTASRAEVSGRITSSGTAPVGAAGVRACPLAGTRSTPVRAASTCTRPLRVVRVLDAGQPRTQAGRLVISGRMADVCAELDRLAALEAAHA